MNMMSKVELSTSTSSLMALPLITSGVSQPFAQLLRKLVAYKAEFEAAEANEDGEFSEYDPDGIRKEIAEFPAQTIGDVAAKAALALYELRGTTQDSLITEDRVTFDSEPEFDQASETFMLAVARDAGRLTEMDHSAKRSPDHANHKIWEQRLSRYQELYGLWAGHQYGRTSPDDPEYECLEKEEAALSEREHRALKVLLKTPAPDQSALLKKLEIFGREFADNSRGFFDHLIADAQRIASRPRIDLDRGKAVESNATIGGKENADLLASYAEVAGEMEYALQTVKSVLQAIHGGGLMDATPTDELDRRNHCAAAGLLDLLERQIDQVLERAEHAPGTDLSVFLSVLAGRARKGSV